MALKRAVWDYYVVVVEVEVVEVEVEVVEVEVVVVVTFPNLFKSSFATSRLWK